jgi:aromatic ring-opening dioxygenase catalytic subunit (LigB family)
MDRTNPEKKARIIYFSHGWGPLPILGDPGHKAMIDFMTVLPNRIPRPEAILVVSAHWEEASATLLGAQHPPMFYDYYGFPDEAYTIQYPAPGDPELAGRIAGLFQKSNIPTSINPRRGIGHGVLIPPEN